MEMEQRKLILTHKGKVKAINVNWVSGKKHNNARGVRMGMLLNAMAETNVLSKPPKRNFKQVEDCKCPSGKITFATMGDAEKAIQLLRKKHRHNYWYKCPMCGMFHTSSKKRGKINL